MEYSNALMTKKIDEMIETFNRLINVKGLINKDNLDEVDLECAYEEQQDVNRPSLAYGSGAHTHPPENIQRVLHTFIPHSSDWNRTPNSINILLYPLNRLEISKGADGMVNWTKTIGHISTC